MPSFIPKYIASIPSKLLKALSDKQTYESDKPVLTKKAILLIAIFGIVLCSLLYIFIPAQANIKISAYCFALSAVLWFTAATIPTPVPMAYPSGPPPKVIKRADWQTRCNQAGAVFTAIGLIIQSIG